MNEPKKKVGRPQAEIDLEQVERLAAIDCTEPEIAAVLGIDYATWKRHKKRNPDILETVERGKENGKASLRRLQWKTASEGNPTMQIWLGKQRLGQQDKKHIEQQQLEPLVIVTDRTDESADEGIRKQAEVSGTGSGEEVRKDLPLPH
jgi:hypothetical protein